MEILNQMEDLTDWTTDTGENAITTVHVQTPHDDIHSVCRKLFFAFAAREKAILEMTAKKVSLEEVFIELTESEVEKE